MKPMGALQPGIPSPTAAAAKSLQLCPTLCDPIDGSPPSLGFSRQEYWSGLPYPQGIFLTQGLKELNLHFLCLLQRQVGSVPQAPSGKPSSLNVFY